MQNYGSRPYVSNVEARAFLNIAEPDANTSPCNDTIRLDQTIKFACAGIEHYIGQEVLSKVYTEEKQTASRVLFLDAIPVQEVYEIKVGKSILKDPNSYGGDVEVPAISYQQKNNVSIDTYHYKFGNGSLSLKDRNSYLEASGDWPLRDSNFTIEMWVKNNRNTPVNISPEEIFSIEDTETNKKIAINLGTQSLSVTGVSNISGSISTNSIKSWHHIALVRNFDTDIVSLYFDGTKLTNNSPVFNLDVYSIGDKITIGREFIGNIDEVRISTTARYSDTFTPSEYRFRPDDNTLFLEHFDEENTVGFATGISDYTFRKDIGQVNLKASTVRPIRVTYKAGYDEAPEELKGATMEYIKLIYKNEQDRQQLRFQDQQVSKFGLFSTGSDFPRHIKRILDLYRKQG